MAYNTWGLCSNPRSGIKPKIWKELFLRKENFWENLWVNKIAMKSCSKICRSEWTLNCRTELMYRIKTHNMSVARHTYIIGHYNPSVRIIDLVSHTTYVVYVNFIHKWRDLLFEVDSERQTFWETFRGSFNLLSEWSAKLGHNSD